jgi:hypothetical protein
MSCSGSQAALRGKANPCSGSLLMMLAMVSSFGLSLLAQA